MVTHETISSAIFTANLPTLVPPNFCTSHFAAGSMEFWCRFGGVRGVDRDDALEELDDKELGDDGGQSSAMVFVWGRSGTGRG